MSTQALRLLPPLPCPAPCSPVQEQQAHPYHHPKPARPRDWGGRSLHRLYPAHPVHRWAGSTSHQPVGGDPGVASPRWQVAQCSLSLLRGPCRTTAVSSATGTPGGEKGLGRGGVAKTGLCSVTRQTPNLVYAVFLLLSLGLFSYQQRETVVPTSSP